MIADTKEREALNRIDDINKAYYEVLGSTDEGPLGKGYLYKEKDKRTTKDACYSEVIKKAMKLIKATHAPVSFFISALHERSMGEGCVVQGAIYNAKFVIAVVNTYNANRGSKERYRLKRIEKSVKCQGCSLWHKTGQCKGNWLHTGNDYSYSDPDEERNDFYEREYWEMKELEKCAIITAYIEKYTKT